MRLRASADANTFRMASTSHSVSRRRRSRWARSRFRVGKFVTFPLWAIAMPYGEFVYSGCASAAVPPPTVG